MSLNNNHNINRHEPLYEYEYMCSSGALLRTLSVYVADAIYLFLLYCIASFID